MSWRLVVRTGPRVERSKHESFAEAMDALEVACRAVAETSRRDTVTLAKRSYEPDVQVQARAELRGPGVTAGIDVRGDGSTEAYTGRWRKELVEQRPNETSYAALRREIGGGPSGPVR